MNKDTKIAIIGAGAMGGAIVKGLLRSGLDPKCLSVANPSPGKLAEFAEQGAFTTSDNLEAALRGDIVVLAVKPWIVPQVAAQLDPHLDGRRQAIVSVAAGVSGETLDAIFNTARQGKHIAISIAIPNTAAALCQSMTFISPVSGDATQAEALFARVGTAMTIDEKMLPAATTLASCGIAYAMRYVRAAMEGGVELGFRAAAAQQIVAQTVMGACSLLSQPGSHPETEIDKVTTPGGLTIRGLNAMERAGFTNAVIEGLRASTKQ